MQQQKFSGGVFSDTLEGGRSGAEIELAPSGICACTPDDEAFVIPYRDCQVEMGGFSGRMVFCRNADRSLTIFCEDKKFPRALSEVSSGLLDDQLGSSIRKRRGDSRRGWLIGTSIFVGIVLLLIGGYFVVRVGARIAVKSLPVSVDQQLGSAAFKSMDLGGPEIKDPGVVGAMQSIIDRLKPHAAIDGLEFEVHVVQSPVVNAFCLPGGTIVVFTGLIENAENANQVAAVLGHEMAHATLRHGLQRISQSMGIWAAVTLLVGDASGLIAAGADLLRFASINSYSRDQENEADEEGVRMLHEADVDPSGMAEFFQIMEREHGDLPGFASWISTHPDHASRIENVKAIVAGLPQREYRPLKLDWADLKQRVKSLDPNGGTD